MTQYSCWVFDDDGQDRRVLVSRLKSILPQCNIKAFPHFFADKKSLEALREEDLPDLLFFDAYQREYGGSFGGRKGFLEFSDFIGWIRRKFPSYSPSHVVFVSLEWGLSQGCKLLAVREYGKQEKIVFTAIDRDEVKLAKEVLEKDDRAYNTFKARKSKSVSLDFPFFDVLNIYYGKKILPSEEGELMTLILQEEMMDIPGFLEEYRKKNISSARVVRKVAQREAIGRVKSFYDVLKKKISGSSFLRRDIPSFEFDQMQGEYCNGLLAFSWEEVEANLANSYRSILVSEHFNPKDCKKLCHLGGLLILSHKAPAHVTCMLASQGVTCFAGISRAATKYEWKEEKGQSVLELEKHDGSIFKMREKSLVTMEAVGDFPGLYDGVVPPSRKQEGPKVELIADLYRCAARELSFPVFSIQANLDSLLQLRDVLKLDVDGLGLVRSEYLLMENDEARKALLQQLSSTPDEDTRYLLCEHHKRVTKKILDATSLKGNRKKEPFPISLRLLDLLPEDIFEEGSRPSHIHKDFRGCQMGLCLPHLYEDQISSTIDQYSDFLFEKYIQEGKDIPVFLKLLAPTIHNLDEVHIIRKMIEARAIRDRLPEETYQFGIMLETKEALFHIGEIAPHVDFINIGSNDLTSDLLGISRSDREAQMNFINDHGFNPFSTLHSLVLKNIVGSVETARAVNPDIKVCLCGEHALDQESFESLYPLHLDSFSLPPTRQNIMGRRADYALYDLRMRFGQGKKPVFK